MSSNNNKQFLLNQMIWIGVSIGISLTISILVPFPLSLVAIVGIFILLNFYIRDRMIRKMGVGDSGVGIFGSMSSSSSSMFGNGILKYYCMSCGTKHREAACAKCRSKMKRVGS